MYKNVQKHLVQSTYILSLFLLEGDEEKMDLDIIELILQDLKPISKEHERIKLYLETHKGNCDYYICNSSKYKERIICLKSIYQSIKLDLLNDICLEINR